MTAPFDPEAAARLAEQLWRQPHHQGYPPHHDELIEKMTALATRAYAAGVEAERARIRRLTIERGPHHVDCPACDDRTAECRCLVNELLTILFREPATALRAPEPPRE